MSSEKLTRDFPTKPGWYWIKEPGFEPRVIEIVWQSNEGGNLVEWLYSPEDEGNPTRPLAMGSYYLGPLEVPRVHTTPVPTVQPSLSARELANEILDDIEIMYSDGSKREDVAERVASLIDQAIEDAANPYKEAFEELAGAITKNVVGLDKHEILIGDKIIRAPKTRALLTKEEKSVGED